MRMPEWPQCSGFQRSTGGRRRCSIIAWRSPRSTPRSSIGGRVSGVRAALENRTTLRQAQGERYEGNMSKLTPDRTAIVTGAGKRVGAEIAGALVADGWSVVGHIRRDGDSVPEGARKVVADLAEPGCAGRIFEAAAGLPPIRLLVNNAARFAWDGFGEFSTAEFDAHMAVNVRAPLLLTEAF